MNRIVSAMLVSLALTPFLTGIARAQITYDPANRAYFVTSDATINTNLLIDPNTGLPYTDGNGADVFVGKDNAVGFNTLAAPVKLTVSDGAIIAGYGNDYPDGGRYASLNVFGSSAADINGGYVVGAFGYNSSAININGGNVGIVYANNRSVVQINSGTIQDSVGSFDNSALSITGGTVTGPLP